MHITPIPIAAIDEAALPRDRAGLDPEPLSELVMSIATGGLRQPVEVWELSEPRGPHRYGLISGFRRLAAFRSLHETAHDKTPFETIPAFVRTPDTYAAAFAAMVEENEVRAELSPFEKGRIAVIARDQGIFGSIEEAVDRLYPNISRMKRTRLRQLAHLAEEIDGHLIEPEKLSLRQALRLADALRMGFGDVIRAAISEGNLHDHETEWKRIAPILAEAEQARLDDPAPRPGRPRRASTLRYGLNIRREKTREGYCLHFTGKLATSDLIDVVFDEIDRLFGPA